MEAKKVRKATPGPFVVDYNTADLPFRMYSKSTQSNVAYFHNEADADTFTAACNAHDDLVKALKALSNMYAKAWDRADGGLFMDAAHIDTFEDLHAQAHAALAAAEQS